MVAGPWVTVDAECLAAWRWVVSEFEEETRSSLIQTGADFSSNLKHHWSLLEAEAWAHGWRWAIAALPCHH